MQSLIFCQLLFLYNIKGVRNIADIIGNVFFYKVVILMFTSSPPDADVKKSKKGPSLFDLFRKGTVAISMITLILSFVLVWFIFTVKHKVTGVEQQWHDYSNEATLSSHVLSRIQANFGYGGFIHHFKNYILRKDINLIPIINKNLSETRRAINDYPLHGIFKDHDDGIFLNELAQVVDQYELNFKLAQRLVAKGISSNEIDRRAKVNDKPAFDAIQHLSQHAVERNDEYARETSKRLESSLNFINFGFLIIIFVLLSGGFLLVLIRKITKINNSLEEGRKFLSDMFEAAPDAMLLVNDLGIISDVNNQTVTLFGFSEQELIGEKVESLMPQRFRDQHMKIRTDSFVKSEDRELRHDIEFYALANNDREIPVEISLSYTTRNEQKYAIVFLRDITERKASEEIMKRNEMMLSRAQQVACIGSWDWDIKSNTMVWSDEVFNIYGFERSLKKMSHDDFMTYVHPKDTENVINAVKSAIVYDQSYKIAHRIIRPDGIERDIYEQGDVFRDRSGKATNIVGVIQDVTEQNQINAKLKLADNVFNSTTECILVTDVDKRILRVNSAFIKLMGYSNEEVIGKTPSELLNSGIHGDEFYDELWASLNESGNWQGEIIDRRKDGTMFPARHNISSVKDFQGNVIQYISIFFDITEKKRADERIQYLAEYDQLTNLPNRTFFNDRLKHSIGRANRHNNKLALMFIDIDGFKEVNDTFGHQEGDELLQHFSQHLLDAVREEDTVARLGGDEFTVILDELHNSEDAAIVANKILQSVADKVSLPGKEVMISASIGISIYPEHGENATTLLKNADIAMYHAKTNGKNQYQFFTKQL